VRSNGGSRGRLAIFADETGEEASCAPEEEADGERADLALERALRQLYGVVRGKERFAGLRQKEHALGGETRSARSAVEECAADLTLKIGELFADGRLGDVKSASGFAEGAVVGNSTEVAQMS